MPEKYEIERYLLAQCGELCSLETKRPGIYQVCIPAHYDDGDPIEIYLEDGPEDKIRISDYGMALMRLSYDYDIDSPNKERILAQIVAENRLKDDQGKIYIDVSPEDLYPGILQLAGGVAKIGSMRYFKREVIQSLFYESVETFIFQRLLDFNPEKNYRPMPDRFELEVDYYIKIANRALFVYAVKGQDKAKNTMINCLFFQRENIPFTSVVIYENMAEIPRKEQALLTDIADKQFSSFEGFKENILGYLNREAMLV